MGTLNLQEPIVCKSKDNEDSNNAKNQNEQLETLEHYVNLAELGLKIAPSSISLKDERDYIDKQVSRIKKGIKGEEELLYQLENTYMPMYILNDFSFNVNDSVSVQIDSIVITKKLIYIIECKNYSGNVSINKNGDFIRVNKKGYGVETINPNPDTQNTRHLNFIKRLLLNSNLPDSLVDRLNSVIVFADPQMIIDSSEATNELQSRVIKVDRIENYIVKNNNDVQLEELSDDEMENIKDFFYEKSSTSKDYSKNYKSIKKNVYSRVITYVFLMVLFCFLTIFYIFHFKFVEANILSKNAPANSGPLDILKFIFMTFKPLGIVSGIIGFFVGFFGQYFKHVASIGGFSILIITFVSIVYSLIIDPSSSIIYFIMSVILLLIITCIWNLIGLTTMLLGNRIFVRLIIQKLCKDDI